MIASILFQCLKKTDDATLEKDAQVKIETNRATRDYLTKQRNDAKQPEIILEINLAFKGKASSKF